MSIYDANHPHDNSSMTRALWKNYRDNVGNFLYEK